MRGGAGALVLAAAALAGCGGGGDGGGAGATSSAPPSGGQVFADNGCGSCHVLGAAGAQGTVGPSLDAKRLTPAQVERVVRRGATGMPGYEGRLGDGEIAAVARYVATAGAAAAAS